MHGYRVLRAEKFIGLLYVHTPGDDGVEPVDGQIGCFVFKHVEYLEGVALSGSTWV